MVGCGVTVGVSNTTIDWARASGVVDGEKNINQSVYCTQESLNWCCVRDKLRAKILPANRECACLGVTWVEGCGEFRRCGTSY